MSNKRLIFLGDIHGNYSVIKNNIESLTDCNLIQVGDFGIGFKRPYYELQLLESLNNQLKSVDSVLYVIRGNHDSPSYFYGGDIAVQYYRELYQTKFGEDELELDEIEHQIRRICSLSNIKFVSDYSVLELSGLNILFCGGAISIDRKDRTEHFSYWQDEVFNFDSKKIEHIVNTYNKIDVVVTHTSPSYCAPIHFDSLVYSYAEYDSTLLKELTAERQIVDLFAKSLLHKFLPQKWVYGHFHFNNNERINGTDYLLLGVNQFYELRFNNTQNFIE